MGGREGEDNLPQDGRRARGRQPSSVQLLYNDQVGETQIETVRRLSDYHGDKLEETDLSDWNILRSHILFPGLGPPTGFGEKSKIVKLVILCPKQVWSSINRVWNFRTFNQPCLQKTICQYGLKKIINHRKACHTVCMPANIFVIILRTLPGPGATCLAARATMISWVF